MNLKSQTSIAGIIYIVFGILCIVLRSRILSFAAACAGIALVAFGLYFIITSFFTTGILMLTLGIVLLVSGWFFVSVMLYVLAVVLIIAGAYRLSEFFKTRAVNDSILRPEGMRPILLMVCGVLLLFNQGGTVQVIFIALGVLLLVIGILALCDSN